MFEIDTSQCNGCKHKKEGMVFTLCNHPKSEYSIGGKVDFHTVSHMIKIQGGRCEHKEA